MTLLKSMTAAAAVLALAACGDSGNDQNGSETSQMPAAETTAPAQSSMEKATEAATKMAEALKLDTSSLEAFKSSLAGMKSSLSGDQQSQLMDALSGMVASDKEGAGGLMDAAKSVASGKSLTETLYEKMGDKLDGKTFEDILAMAS